jgi:hypothetical protein
MAGLRWFIVMAGKFPTVRVPPDEVGHWRVVAGNQTSPFLQVHVDLRMKIQLAAGRDPPPCAVK